MGAGAKNLEQIMLLTERGLLPPGGAICDIGATELMGDALVEGCTSFLEYYAGRTFTAQSPADAGEAAIKAVAARGFLGDLLELAGFTYVSLDIFPGKNSILFDLNAHSPGPGLSGRFDLVLNFGTTEHIIDQLLAQRSIYDLLKVGGVAYHDLPMSGFNGHGYFKYDPMFFRHLAQANGAEIVIDRLSAGAAAAVPSGLVAQGVQDWRDFGVEFAFVKTAAGPMRLPLESSTSLAVDPAFATATSDQVLAAGRDPISYADPAALTPAEPEAANAPAGAGAAPLSPAPGSLVGRARARLGRILAG